MRGKDRYLEVLAGVPLFSACSKKDLQTIARASDEVRIEKGKTLVQQGQTGHEFFAIIDGKANVVRDGKKIATLGPGDYFGEMALLDREPRSASVVAASDMDLIVLGQREFAGVIDAVPSMAHKLLTAMARRLRDADTKALSH